jgi:hypothetical protein
LQKCIELASKEYDSKSFGVLHLTFDDKVEPTYQEAQDRMNSLRSNILSERYSVRSTGGKKYNNFITICERGGKNGRLHFHVLVIGHGKDYSTGSHWTFHKGSKKREFHPNGDCRAEWEFFRGLLKKYNFGEYVRFEPLRSIEGGAKYFSKYVGKGHYTRDESMFGKQLIRYGNGFDKYHSMKFAWVGGIARGRRGVIGQIGSMYGIQDDIFQLNHVLGSRWQHWAKDQILACCCFTGEALGKASREFIQAYASNKWGVSVQFGVVTMKNMVVCGHDEWGMIYTSSQLYEWAMRELAERVEEIEFSQYDPNLIQF